MRVRGRPQLLFPPPVPPVIDPEVSTMIAKYGSTAVPWALTEAGKSTQNTIPRQRPSERIA
jgi:hypothetical protein